MNPFHEHNREVERVWAAFSRGEPYRVPMVAGVSDRYYVLNDETNPRRVPFGAYSRDPDLMFDMQCAFAEYARFHVPGDHPMGVPEEGWTVSVDFQNYYEAAWYGAEVVFPEQQVPYAVPLLRDENKEQLFIRGLPDPTGGFMETALRFYERFVRLAETRTILGQRITNVAAPFTGSDGPFTLACELRGPDALCVDMLEEPEYYHRLMDYLTQSIIDRIKVWRGIRGEPVIEDSFGFADDSIALLSAEQYRQYVLPYHKRMKEALSTGEKPGGAHLCGDATRHFKLIRDELNIHWFDTGFPVDHRSLCLELGPEVTVQGGPSVGLIAQGTDAALREESRRILESVKPVTKRFVFRDGNDIPPHTPLSKVRLLYDLCLEYGRY